MSWFPKSYASSGVPVLQRIAGLSGAVFCAKRSPIGVDVGDDALTMAQFENNERGIILVAAGSKNRPEDVELGSSNWQRWAIEAIRELTSDCGFHGRDVIAAIPASEVFIDHIKMPKIEGDRLEEALFSKIKQKLPFEADDTMIKYLPVEGDNFMVVAVEREKIDRHLAIYEKAHLQIKSIAVWPSALANSYARFFGRRKSDVGAIVMLLNINMNYTNVVICRHKDPLFACSIPVGAKQLEGRTAASADEMTAKLVLELTGCRRHFGAMHEKAQLERLIFLSGHSVNRDIYTTIAKQMDMQAQMGDCMAAVETVNSEGLVTIERRGCTVNWVTAFGLSLS